MRITQRRSTKIHNCRMHHIEYGTDNGRLIGIVVHL